MGRERPLATKQDMKRDNLALSADHEYLVHPYRRLTVTFIRPSIPVGAGEVSSSRKSGCLPQTGVL